MERYVAFLRGMNLGNRRIKNEELRAEFEALGFADVATFRASGNVIFDSADGKSEGDLAEEIEAGLGEGLSAMRWRCSCAVAPRWRRSPPRAPFEARAVAGSKGKLQVLLLLKKPAAAARRMVLALASEEDRLAIEGRELYWLPSGGTIDSDLDLKTIECRSRQGDDEDHGHDRPDRRQALLRLGGAAAARRHLSWFVPMAIATASHLGVHVGGRAAVRRRLVQARAAGADDALRAQRRRQVDPAADPRRASWRPTRARSSLRQGRPRRAARPAPAARGASLPSATTCSPAAAEMLETEAELERLEAEMSDGAHDEETMAAYSAAQQRLEAAGGYRWRDDVARGAARPRLRPPSSSSGALYDLLRRRADARLARPRAGDASPTCCCSTSRPTTSTSPRSSGSSATWPGLDAAVVLVAHDRWFLEAVGTSVLEIEAGRARFFAGPWHAWRTGAGGARDRARQGDRAPAGGDRADGALRRALPLQGDQGAARRSRGSSRSSEVKRDAAVARSARRRASCASPSPTPERAGTSRAQDARARRIEVPGRTLLDDAELRDRARRARRPRRPQRRRQDDADRDPRRAARAGRGQRSRIGHNVKLGYLSQHADTRGGRRARCSRRPSARPG